MLAIRSIRSFSTVQVPLKVYSLEGRYASALFSAASRKSELQGVETELDRIKAVIQSSNQLKGFLENPVIGREIKKGYVTQMLVKEKYSETVVNFFKVLAENGRLSLTSKVLATFQDIMKAQRGQVDVKIVSSKELPKETIEKLKETISKKLVKPGKQLALSTKVDPAILGGLVLQIGDKTIDMSVASKLLKIKQSLA